MKITRCKLLRKQQLRLLEFFVLEVTARSAADLLDIQPNSAALFYRKLREMIAYYLEQEAHEIFDGAVELDESYFGGVRKGKRGRGAAGKVVVFGILKRGGKVFTKVVNDTKTETLLPLIARKIAPDSIVYTDCYRSYNALDVSDFHHERIITPPCLQEARTTSMALRTSGIRPNVCYGNTTGFPRNRFRYSSRNVNSGSIRNTQTTTENTEGVG